MSLGVLQGSSAFEDRRPVSKYLFLQIPGGQKAAAQLSWI
jgi:hypothetical protein